MALLKPISHSHELRCVSKRVPPAAGMSLLSTKEKIYIQYLTTVLIIMFLQQWNCQQQKRKTLPPFCFWYYFLFQSHILFLWKVSQPIVPCIQTWSKCFHPGAPTDFVLHCVALSGICQLVPWCLSAQDGALENSTQSSDKQPIYVIESSNSNQLSNCHSQVKRS